MTVESVETILREETSQLQLNISYGFYGRGKGFMAVRLIAWRLRHRWIILSLHTV